jgi:hypothetical protein
MGRKYTAACYFLSILLLFTLTGLDGLGQLLQWSTFGNVGTETTESSVFNHPNILASSLTLGSVSPASNGNRFGGTGWFKQSDQNPSTLANAIAGNSYIQFVASPVSGFSFTPTSFVFSWEHSAAGPSSLTLRSSADNFSTDLASITGTSITLSSYTITITGLTNITTATTFRLYGYGATSSTGSGGFDINSNIVNVQLNGTTTSTEIYRSLRTGNFDETTTWEYSSNNGNTWANSQQKPGNANNIIIQPSHNITLTSDVTRLGTTTNNGTIIINNKTLTFKNAAIGSGTYTGSPTSSLVLDSTVGGTFILPTPVTLQNVTVSGNRTLLLSGATNLTIHGALNISKDAVFDNGGESEITNGGAGGSVNISGTFITRDAQGLTGTSAAIPNINPVINAGSTIEYAKAGDQTITGPIAYSKLVISGSGVKTTSNSIPNIDTVTIRDNAIVDVQGHSFGGANSNTVFNMTGGRFRSSKLTISQPEMQGTYNLIGGVVELYGTGANEQHSLRGGKRYYNVEINANSANTTAGNVGLSSSVEVEKSFTVNAPTILNLTSGDAISGNGSITFNTGSGLFYRNQNGINAGNGTAATEGHFRNTGGRFINLSIAAWTGAGNMRAGTALPSSLTNLFVIKNTINDTVSLNNSLTISGNTNFTAGTLSINGNTLTLNNINTGTGSIGGSLTSNLTITGSGTINFAQRAPYNVINNVTINTSGTVSLGNNLNIAGALSLNAGTLNLNGKTVTLKAGTENQSLFPNTKTYPATAIVTPVGTGAAISYNTGGQLIVERYIPARRAYRFITPSLAPAASIRESWMENGNYIPGYGTHITGTGSGFDATATNNPSLFIYNNPSWAAVTNTSSRQDAGKGYRLFVRGDRSTDLTTNTPNPTPTILRTAGRLITGTVMYTSSSSGLNTFPILSPGVNEYSFIGNPYAAPISWNKITKNNISNSYTAWDPTINVRGAYVYWNGYTSNNLSSGVNEFIQPGQAFFVQTTGSNPSITFAESNKDYDTSLKAVFRPQQNMPKVTIALLLNKDGGSENVADAATAIFDNAFSAAVDDFDALKITNLDENISISKAGGALSIDSRPAITSDDTLHLSLSQFTKKSYFLAIKAENFEPGLSAYLADAYLKKETAINLSDTTLVPFYLSQNSASASPDRFQIIFKAPKILPVTNTIVRAFKKEKGIQVEWSATNEENTQAYEVEKSIDGVTFERVYAVNARNNNLVTGYYSWIDNNATIGKNFYRIKTIEKSGEVKYTFAVELDILDADVEIKVFPNPITDHIANIYISNKNKEKYSLTFYNNIGQRVYGTFVLHEGGAGNYKIIIPQNVSRGSYNLEINSSATTKTIGLVLK